MKITKRQLKQIIKEEILAEISPVDGGRLKTAGTALKTVAGPETLAEVVMDILTEFLKMFRTYEKQTNITIETMMEELSTIKNDIANKADSAHSHGGDAPSPDTPAAGEEAEEE